jgi:hypothetical protein
MLEFMQGALVACEDHQHGYCMAWYGGHGIHVYDLLGTEIAFWAVECHGENCAHPHAVEDAMKENMATGEYTELIERP